MAERSPKTKLSSAILIVVCFAAAAHELGATAWPSGVSGVALLLFFALEWKGLAWVARGIIGVALASLILFSSLDRVSPDVLASAINRGAFLAFFVTSLNVLRDAAQTSRLVRRCGELIVNQPPGRRYTVMTLGGHLFGVFLNLGSVNLLGTMIHRTIDSGQKGVEPRIREIRLQRMTLAMLRGFCAVPLWAPTSVTVAIVLAGLTDLSWFDVLPLGLTGAAIFLGTGWAIDRLSFPRGRATTKPRGSKTVILTFLPLMLLVILIPGAAFAVSHFLSLRLISALLICIPVFGLGWVFMQYLRAGGANAVFLTARRVQRRMLPSFCDLRTEIGIFASSGFLGVLLLPQIDIVALGNAITGNGLSEGWILVLSSWTITLLALVGINPIITVTLIIEALPKLPGLDFQSTIIAVMATMTWAIVVGLSPITASTRLTGRCVHKSPSEIGFRWNGLFCLTMLGGLSAFLLGFG